MQIGTFNGDQLISGDAEIKTESGSLVSGTLVRGSVVGRVKVSVPTSGTAGSNTGNGTATAVSGGTKTKQGTYTLKCTRVVTNGGEFALLDPDGKFLGLTLITAGAGGTGVLKSDYLNATITDGSTDFAVGDSFTVAVSSGVPTTGTAGSNTGNGTVTEVEARRDLKIGIYTLTCVAAATHSGTFDITDPDGLSLPSVTIPAGAGNNVVFDNDQIKGKITDGSTDFIVGDSFTVTTTIEPRSVKLLDKTATDGSSDPYGILLEDVDASASAKPCALAVQGSFNQRALVFATGTDVEDVRDRMRELGMFLTGSVPIEKVV